MVKYAISSVVMLVLVPLAVLLQGCEMGPNYARRSSFGVAESFFGSLMAKDYRQAREWLGDHAGVEPSSWDNGEFIHDSTRGKVLKQIWIRGPIADYQLNGIEFTDYVNLGMPLKLAHIHFALSAQRYVALVTIEPRTDGMLGENGWYATVTRLNTSYILGFEDYETLAGTDQAENHDSPHFWKMGPSPR